MARPTGCTVGALLATSAAAVLTLCATRPHLAGYPTTWSADDVAHLACWAIAAAFAARLSFTAFWFSAALAGAGVLRALRSTPSIARHALRASLAGSLAVAPPPPVTVHVGPDGRLVPVAPPTSSPTTTTSTTIPPTTPQRPLAPAPPTSARMHRVVAGDNLWEIARAELARLGQRDPVDRDIAPYWLRVIAANHATLRSGDPNLIYPGEIVELPNP